MLKRIVLACVLAVACSKEAPPPTTTAAEAPKAGPAPTAQQARDLIANAPEFGEHEFTNAAVSIPVSGAVMSEPLRQTAKQLAGAGWLAFDGAGDIMLTDKSRNDKRFILRPNGILDVVPLAKKEMGNVSAVRVNQDGSATADFSWKWIPNDIGNTLTSGVTHDRFAATQNATATLMWNGTNWTLIKIEAR
ncbi:MAG: hypothetical protein M3Q69_12245 [Acidobacteriota bacterium]|nr:hypothetical protein [Acidobacteriota bacterium]